jgi:methyl-accepting chemotaxis protein
MRKRGKPIEEQKEIAPVETEEVEAKAEEVPVLELETETAMAAAPPLPDAEAETVEVQEIPTPTLGPEAVEGEEALAAWSEVEIAQDAEIELPAEEIPEPEPMQEETAFEAKATDVRQTPARTFGPEPPLVEVVNRGAGWGWLLLMGLISAVAGAVLALVILWAINGTLDLRTATSRALQAEAARLDAQIGPLQADLGQMKEQVAAMEELAPRLDKAEADIQRLEQDLATTQADLESMSAEMAKGEKAVAVFGENLGALEQRASALEERLGTFSQELEEMRQATQRFGAFLTGLRALLDQTQGPATPASLGGQTPMLTPTPGGVVTVIPLATPMPTP